MWISGDIANKDFVASIYLLGMQECLCDIAFQQTLYWAVSIPSEGIFCQSDTIAIPFKHKLFLTIYIIANVLYFICMLLLYIGKNGICQLLEGS